VLWLLPAVALSIRPFLWHVDFFRGTGPYFPVIRALPLVLAGALVLYLWFRKRGLWRIEPLVLVLPPVLLALVEQPAATILVLWAACASYLLGCRLLRALLQTDREGPIACLAGLGVLIVLLAVAGKIGWYYRPVFFALLVIVTLAGAPFWSNLLRACSAPWNAWRGDEEMASSWVGLSVFATILFSGCTALMALTPVTAFDVLAYHFPLAAIYLRDHRLVMGRTLVQSFYPQGGEAMMTLGFALGGRPAAQLIMLVFFVLFLWIVLRIARDCASSRAAAFSGVVAAATMPFLHWTGSVPKNDLALAAFQAATLYAFLQWQKGRGAGWIVAGGFFLGHSFGIKHVALFGAIPLGLMFVCRVPGVKALEDSSPVCAGLRVLRFVLASAHVPDDRESYFSRGRRPSVSGRRPGTRHVRVVGRAALSVASLGTHVRWSSGV